MSGEGRLGGLKSGDDLHTVLVGLAFERLSQPYCTSGTRDTYRYFVLTVDTLVPYFVDQPYNYRAGVLGAQVRTVCTVPYHAAHTVDGSRFIRAGL